MVKPLSFWMLLVSIFFAPLSLLRFAAVGVWNAVRYSRYAQLRDQRKAAPPTVLVKKWRCHHGERLDRYCPSLGQCRSHPATRHRRLQKQPKEDLATSVASNSLSAFLKS